MRERNGPPSIFYVGIQENTEEMTMISQDKIREHMEVRSADGSHVGTVDHMDGTSRIKLTKTDAEDGKHHLIPLEWVDHVDAHVHLSRSASDVRSNWETLN
jgi:hypothetical protein